MTSGCDPDSKIPNETKKRMPDREHYSPLNFFIPYMFLLYYITLLYKRMTVSLESGCLFLICRMCHDILYD